MDITTRTSATVTIVRLQGEMTAEHGMRGFGDTIRTSLEDGHTRLVVDCTELPYFDSAGISEFVQAYKLAGARGGTVKIIMPLRPIGGWGGMMIVTKVLTIFDCFRTEAEAVASFSGDRT
jgi:anti-anti-sigma factor